MKVINIPLDQIKPYWRNPRDNEAAVDAVKASIERYGFNVPLVLDESQVIITGHTRYKALLELGWTEAPCVIVSLPADKVKEYRIADNKTSELADWDMDALIPELREILDADAMQVFFTDIDLDKLLHETATVDTPTADEITETQERLETRFEEVSQKAQASLIEVVCPHCGETFEVDPAELTRILEQRKTD